MKARILAAVGLTGLLVAIILQITNDRPAPVVITTIAVWITLAAATLILLRRNARREGL